MNQRSSYIFYPLSRQSSSATANTESGTKENNHQNTVTMKFILAATFIALSAQCFAQIEAPWNPDSNGDQMITTTDMLQVLTVFGNTFVVEVNCTDYQSELDSLSNLVDILNGYDLEGCTDTNACNYDPYANTADDSCDYLDLCGVCGGDGSSCSACDADVCLWIEDNSIYYATDLDITGFQFNFSCDASPTVCCGPAGWTVVAGTVAIVGFELTLNTITGSGILFSYTDGACFEFEEIILADAQGNPIESIQLGWE